jgi:hypothetical protein
MTERYCIVNLLQKNKEGLTFGYLRRLTKIKELRLKLRLTELIDRDYIRFHFIDGANKYINNFREE